MNYEFFISDACANLFVQEFEDLSALESDALELAGSFTTALRSDGFLKNALSLSGRTADWNSAKFSLAHIDDATEIVASFWARIDGTQAASIQMTLDSGISGLTQLTTLDVTSDKNRCIKRQKIIKTSKQLKKALDMGSTSF